MPSQKPVAMYRPGDEFPMRSSRPLHPDYTMVVTPEGWVVHQHEGCENERFRGVGHCRHSKTGETFVTRDLVTYNPQHQVSTRLEFTSDELQTIKNTICRGVSDVEAQLFIATCQSVGLNPFLHQIWAIPRNVNVGTQQNPRWEKQMTIQTGIDGYRVIRDRLVDAHGNALFDGMEGPQWSDDNGRSWSDWWDSPKPPKLARVAIYRKGISRPFVAQARWDAYTQNNAMWKQMGAEQLAKCAEVLALRRAFPADMNALPSGNIAEMEPPPVVSWPTPAQEIAAVNACKVCGSVLHDTADHPQVDQYGVMPDQQPEFASYTTDEDGGEHWSEPEAFEPDLPVVDEPQGDAPDIEALRAQVKDAFAALKQAKGAGYGAIYNEAHKRWPGLHNGDAKAMAPEEAAVLLAELQEAL